MLLQAGALINKCDCWGLGPLYGACSAGQLKSAVILIEHGADINKKSSSKSETPLIVSASYGRVPLISFLLAHGADINSINNEGHSALQVAHLKGHSKCVEVLLEHGADESSLQGLEFASKSEVL